MKQNYFYGEEKERGASERWIRSKGRLLRVRQIRNMVKNPVSEQMNPFAKFGQIRQIL